MMHLLLAIIYLSFISLGLPDALLGSAWPTMYPELHVPVSCAGIISMTIAAGTVVSSLQSDRLTRAFGTGRVTAFSVMLTAAALFGFSTSHSFLALCLWAIPYGLGAGSVDASLNNYVAVHYTSRHMSWLHCMWGIGASTGPYVMGYVLTQGLGWNTGYLCIALFQVALTAVLMFSLPAWKKTTCTNRTATPVLSLPQVLSIPGAKSIITAFFCYNSLESTAGLWASSYLVLHHGLTEETAAFFASLFYIGITVGRAANGFLTLRFSDRQLIRFGSGIIALGFATMLLPSVDLACGGLVLAGLGCAPIYPCIIHSTPEHFGAERSQAVIGVQMACAYVGVCLIPPFFGFIANHISVALLPGFLLLLLLVMVITHERTCRQTVRE